MAQKFIPRCSGSKFTQKVYTGESWLIPVFDSSLPLLLLSYVYYKPVILTHSHLRFTIESVKVYKVDWSVFVLLFVLPKKNLFSAVSEIPKKWVRVGAPKLFFHNAHYFTMIIATLWLISDMNKPHERKENKNVKIGAEQDGREFINKLKDLKLKIGADLVVYLSIG